MFNSNRPVGLLVFTRTNEIDEVIVSVIKLTRFCLFTIKADEKANECLRDFAANEVLS